MTGSQIIFYVLSAFILGTGLIAVTTRKIFRSAIWLLFSLGSIAGLFFWMELEFLAAVQIIVYVGGIVVLIIFSIFLTQQAGNEMPKPVLIRAIFSALSVIFGFAFAYSLIYQHPFTAASNVPIDAGVAAIGSQMLSITEHGYILPFEAVSILLLAAMIGCIVIAIKQEPSPKKIGIINGAPVSERDGTQLQREYILPAKSELPTPE
jgi:NADH-quinone oxidoreductase subunit J